MTEFDLFHSGFLQPPVAYLGGALVAIVVLLLLYQELRRNRRAGRFLLYLTRGGMVAILVVLLAQPNLLLTKRTQQPGQALVLVDDSASMFTTDQYEDPETQLTLARLLGVPELSGRDTTFATRAQELATLRARLAPLRQAVTEAQRAIATGLPWADRHQTVVAAAGPAANALRGFLTNLGAGAPASADLAAAGQNAAAMLGEAGQAGTIASLSGRPLGEKEWVALAQRLDELEQRLEQLSQNLTQRQLTADREFLAAPGRQAAIGDPLAKLTRHELAQRLLAATPALAAVPVTNLVNGPRPVAAVSAAPRTDLVRPLANALRDRPLDLLNAVILFSDGAQNVSFDLDQLEVYRKRGVKLLVVGVGSAQGRPPLLVQECECPPLAVARTPVPITLTVATTLPRGSTIELSYAAQPGAAGTPPPAAAAARPPTSSGESRQGEPVHSLPFRETITVGDQALLHHRVLLALEQAGPQNVTITLVGREPGAAPAPAADAKPDAKGEAPPATPPPATPAPATPPAPGVTTIVQVSLYVRAERPSVLLVADRPDRFTQAVLELRRFGLRVYPIFSFNRKENVVRGKARQSLPKDPEDWGRYDLVILAGAPYPTFSPQDADAIVRQVRTNGLALMLLPPAGASPKGEGYLDAVASRFGLPVPSHDPLPLPTGITPAAEAERLPALALARETIHNQNLWQQFAAPRCWYPVPAQDFTLVAHAATQTPVATLGFQRRGKVMLLGLSGFGPMNEWQPIPFQTLVDRLVMDLLAVTGNWPVQRPAGEPAAETAPGGEKPPAPPAVVGNGIGLYPALPPPGSPALVLVHLGDATQPADVKVTGPDQQTTVLTVPVTEGWGRLRHSFAQAGTHTLALAQEPGAPPLVADLQTPPSAETFARSLRQDFLQELARAADGEYVSLGAFPQAVQQLEQKTRQAISSTLFRTRDYLIPLLLAFIALAAADFAIRKQIGLVL